MNKYNIFRILKKTVSHIQTATVLHCLILKEGDRKVVYTCKTFKEPWNFLERSNTSIRLIEKSITNPFFFCGNVVFFNWYFVIKVQANQDNTQTFPDRYPFYQVKLLAIDIKSITPIMFTSVDRAGSLWSPSEESVFLTPHYLFLFSFFFNKTSVSFRILRLRCWFL